MLLSPPASQAGPDQVQGLGLSGLRLMAARGASRQLLQARTWDFCQVDACICGGLFWFSAHAVQHT